MSIQSQHSADKRQACNILNLPLNFFMKETMKHYLSLKFIAVALISNAACLSHAQTADKTTDSPGVQALPTVPADGWANESKDLGISPTSYPQRGNYGTDTPISIPGGKVLKTDGVLAFQKSGGVLIDVYNKVVIPGAISAIGLGEGALYALEKEKLTMLLAKVAGDDKSKPLAFYCTSAKCWHGYNAALHVIALGYTNVYWYRGGIASWRASGGKTAPIAETW